MADDRQSADPAPADEAVPPAQVPNENRTHIESTPPADRPALMVRHWRPVMFLVILLVAATLGFYFKSNASPGTEPPTFRNQPPQYINIYESNPNVPIHVDVYLGQGPVTELSTKGFTNVAEVVDITASPGRSANPGTVILTSNIPGYDEDTLDTGFRVKIYQSGRGLGSADRAMSFAIPVSLSSLVQSKTLFGTVVFGPVPIIFQENGAIFGHLPSVGLYESAFSGPVQQMQAGYDRTDQLKFFATTLGSAPQPAFPGYRMQFLSGPIHISYTEDVGGIVPALRNEQIDYSVPSVDSSSDTDYVWRTNYFGGMDPIFKATDPNAVDSQNRAAFTSGIAFGVAGAAAIAVVQELPEELALPAQWLRSKRRRKSPLQRAEGPS